MRHSATIRDHPSITLRTSGAHPAASLNRQFELRGAGIGRVETLANTNFVEDFFQRLSVAVQACRYDRRPRARAVLQAAGYAEGTHRTRRTRQRGE